MPAIGVDILAEIVEHGRVVTPASMLSMTPAIRVDLKTRTDPKTCLVALGRRRARPTERSSRPSIEPRGDPSRSRGLVMRLQACAPAPASSITAIAPAVSGPRAPSVTALVNELTEGIFGGREQPA